MKEHDSEQLDRNLNEIDELRQRLLSKIDSALNNMIDGEIEDDILDSELTELENKLVNTSLERDAL